MGASFWKAQLQSADFRGANLTGVDFDYTDLRAARFTEIGSVDCRYALMEDPW